MLAKPLARTRREFIPTLPRDAWVVLGGDALSAVGTGLTLPFLLIYLSQVRGIGLALAGLAVAMKPAAGLVGNPLAGWLADRGGARNAVIAGVLVAAAGSVSITLVHQTWQAFAAAGLVGLGISVAWPAQDALLAATVSPEQRSSVFSVRHATLNAGVGLGALIAAGIVDTSRPGSFVVVYLIDAASFLAVIPLLLTLPARARGRDREGHVEAPSAGGYRLVFRDRTFRRVWVLTALLIAVGHAQMLSGFPVYATRPGGVSPGAVSLAFVVNTITVIGAQLVVLRLVRGWRRTAALRMACAGFGGAWAIVLTAGQLGGGFGAVFGFATAMVVFGLAETLLSPALSPMVNDLAPEQLRGRYNAASSLAWTTGFLTGPALAGVALDAGAGSTLFIGLIGACALAGLSTRRLERHLPTEANLVRV